MNHVENPGIFGVKEIEVRAAELLLKGVSEYIGSCPDAFPAKSTSLELLDRVRSTGLFDRMVAIEQKQEHFPFSHAAVTSHFAANISRQINALSSERLGVCIVDEPLTTTSTLLHDIGKIISTEDIKSFGLTSVDLSPYTAFFPETASKELQTNDILKTIALILSFGPQFNEHAHTAGHSIYHLLYDPSLTLERLVLMLADFSVVNLPTEPTFSWPRAGYTPSLVHRLDKVKAKYRGSSENYLAFYLRLEAIKTNLINAGVHVPPNGQGPDLERDKDGIHFAAFLKLLELLNIRRRSISSDLL